MGFNSGLKGLKMFYKNKNYRSRYSDWLRVRWSEDRIPVRAKFSLPVHTCHGSSQPPVQWVRGFSGSKERPGRDADPSTDSSDIGHERIELYLYSPYGPYGLYRASVRV
jgi:hypothetical protein